MSFWADPISFIITWFLGLLASWGLAAEAVKVIGYVLGAFIMAMGSLMLVIFLIWVERKLIARVQDRLGPNRIGPWGIFQTFADMLKIFTKEYITPNGVDIVPYNIAPVLAVAAVIMVWAVLPFTRNLFGVDLNVGVLYVLAASSLGELAVILAGWGSNNKFALLGALRAVAQMISYSVPLVICLLLPVMFTGSMSMTAIVEAQGKGWFILLVPIPALIFFVAAVAETGRVPFDLVEAESEIVAGFNIEYSGLKFGMFYVGDFLHAFTMALLFATLFLGGWRGPGAESLPILGIGWFFLKTALVYFLTVLMRGVLPRFRIDQMTYLNWKFLTPFALLGLMLIALLNKVVPVDASNLVRILILLAGNGVLLAGMLAYLRVFSAGRKRPLVAIPQSRPGIHSV